MATTFERIQLNRKTAAQWTASNLVLLPGEAGVETDTHKVKFGDGTTAWTGLPYAGDAAVAGVATVNGRAGSVTLTPTDVQLGNVANLAPANLPVSTAQATALAGKADYPPGGVNGQQLVKNGSGTAWSSLPKTVPYGATAPDPSVSPVWVDTSTSPPVMKWWTGTAWTPLDTTTTGSGTGTGTGGGTGGGTGVVPNGPAGTWTVKFADEFTGTSLDTTVWDNSDGFNRNNITARASNLRQAGSNLYLKLSSLTDGAQVVGRTASLAIGDYLEYRANFPGDGTHVYNWPACFTNGGPDWPASGEFDVAEVWGGLLQVAYHGQNSNGTQYDDNYGPPAGYTNPGYYGGGFHTYGVHRKATTYDIYWDGVLVVSNRLTHDNGKPHYPILIMGQPGSFWAPTQVLVGAELAVDYVRVFTPAAGGGGTVNPTLPYTDTFTGTTGTPWPAAWSATPGATIQGNAGAMATGTGGYAQSRSDLSGVPQTSDTDIVASVTFTGTAEQYASVGVCSDANGSGLNNALNSYTVLASQSSGTIQVNKRVGGTVTVLAAVTGFTFTAGVKYRIRLQRKGTTLQFRCWPATATEPTTWNGSYTDSGLTAGWASLGVMNGNDGINRVITWDDVTVSIPA